MIVRHLVLPGSVDEARGVLDFIRENLPLETHISLMSQYTPMFELQPPLNRRLLKREYKRAVDYALSSDSKTSTRKAFHPQARNSLRSLTAFRVICERRERIANIKSK